MNSKSVPPSPTSASAYSSENSETHSVSDENPSASAVQNRTLGRRASAYDLYKNLKAGKALAKKPDPKDPERPPWRSVANVTPIKVNKNALLKAKILDATRRALLAQRICHMATQTDPIFTTVLLREKQTDIQKDLIGLEDKAMETDGAVMIRQEYPGGFLITQTIGQMTDLISNKEMATQTPLPKINLSFSLLNKHNKLSRPKPKLTLDEKLHMNDQRLQLQIEALRKIDNKLSGKMIDNFSMDQYPSNENYEYSSANDIDQQSFSVDPSAYNRQFETNNYCYSISTLENLDAAQGDQKEEEKEKVATAPADGECVQTVKPNTLDPTLTSWEDFEISDEDIDLPDLPRKTISDGSTPWNNFKDLVIGQRLANMRLSPITPRPSTGNGIRKSVSWDDRQHQAVSELLTEASALIDVFDQMSMILGPEVPLHSIPRESSDMLAIPPSKWDPILSESCDLLNEKLQNFKPRHHFKPFSARK